MASESMPSAWTRSSRSGIRLAPSSREYSLWVWRWTNAMWSLARPRVELLEHPVEGEPPGLEQHDQVVQQVRCLAREARAVLGGGGNDGFHGLFAHLLGDLRDPRVEQLGGI